VQSAHNNADGNSSLEAFSADIAHHNQHAAVLFRPDAEEIPAHLFSRCIGALDPEPQNILVRCNQLLLHLACGFQLDTQFVAGAPLLPKKLLPAGTLPLNLSLAPAHGSLPLIEKKYGYDRKTAGAIAKKCFLMI